MASTRTTTMTRDEELSAMQRERIARAVEEGEKFAFVLDTSGRFFHCLNPESGQFHQVSARGCSCRDWQYRCGPRGLMCKHMTALVLKEKK